LLILIIGAGLEKKVDKIIKFEKLKGDICYSQLDILNDKYANTQKK
jgi:hypothetical protein